MKFERIFERNGVVERMVNKMVVFVRVVFESCWGEERSVVPPCQIQIIGVYSQKMVFE